MYHAVRCFEAIGELDNVGAVLFDHAGKRYAQCGQYRRLCQYCQRSLVLRQLIHIGTEISDSAFNTEGRDTADLLENAERQVFQIAEQRQKGKALVLYPQIVTG